MKVERLLARRFLYQAPQGNTSGMEERAERRKKLRPVIKISTAGIASGTALILISIFIIQGFKKEIDQMINGFIGTLRISNFQNNFDQYTLPLTASNEMLTELSRMAIGVDAHAKVSTFVDEMALLKSDSAFSGALMHGLSYPSDLVFFQRYLKAGALPTSSGADPSHELLLPQAIAQQMGYNVGDQLYAYFLIGEAMKVRKYTVAGIYQTGFEQYDQHVIIADLRGLQSLKGWGPQEYSGITITLPASRMGDQLYPEVSQYLSDLSRTERSSIDSSVRERERYALFTARDLNFNIFGWLSLLDANVLLIFILMLAVAAMTIITGVIVLILEKVRAIATLKALGQHDRSLQSVFAYIALHIIIRGILCGSAVALLLGWIQKLWRPLTLDPSQYYITYVPIEIAPIPILLTLVSVLVGVFLFVLIPTTLIQKLNTSEVLRFE